MGWGLVGGFGEGVPGPAFPGGEGGAFGGAGAEVGEAVVGFAFARAGKGEVFGCEEVGILADEVAKVEDGVGAIGGISKIPAAALVVLGARLIPGEVFGMGD